jgi:Domain of unknown function (DUF4124)
MSVRLIVLVLAAPLLMGSEIYRYIDANGVVTYAQQLPYGVKGELIKTTAGAPTVTVPAAPAEGQKSDDPKLSPQQQAMLDNLKKAEQARREEVTRIRDANCTRSKDVLERLSSAGRIRVKGPDGQETKMPEEERQARIDEAQKGVVANCNPEPEGTTQPPAVANNG